MQLRAAKEKIEDKQIATPGILGGLGPLAHIELEKRILQQRHDQKRQQQSEVSCDRDYPTWLMISATQIPDRTQSLQGGECCISALQHYAKQLESMGSDFLVIPCNTAHAFYKQVQATLDIPWLHLMDATTQAIYQQYPTVKRVGILATDGTIKAGLYAKSLRKAGFTPIEPAYGSLTQKQVMQSIYAPNWGIKTTGTQISDRAMRNLSEAAISLYSQGAELLIAGCTELSIACSELNNLPIPWLDPLQVIAADILTYAYGDRALPTPSHQSLSVINYAAL